MDKKILKYQEVDSRLKKIENELASSEEKKKAVVAKRFLDTNVETVNKLDARAAELNMAFENAIASQKRLKEQEDDFAQALQTASDENEINYLIKKIDELLVKIKAVESELNKISNEMQNIIKEYSNNRATEKNAVAQYDKYGKLYKELKASKADEIKEIEAELAVLKKDIDPVVMEKYLQKRADKKIFPIFYEVNGDTCGFCNMGQSLSALSKLKNGEIIECEQCRRLLYKS